MVLIFSMVWILYNIESNNFILNTPFHNFFPIQISLQIKNSIREGVYLWGQGI